MTESDILYENGDYWVRKNHRGDFEVYRSGLTHSTLCATVGRGLSTDPFVRAKAEADRRAGKKHFTLGDAKRELTEHGMALSKRDGEYRVNFRGGREATAYYASDLDDAVATGIKMSEQGRK